MYVAHDPAAVSFCVSHTLTCFADATLVCSLLSRPCQINADLLYSLLKYEGCVGVVYELGQVLRRARDRCLLTLRRAKRRRTKQEFP